MYVVVQEARQLRALSDGEVDVRSHAGHQLAVEANVDTINARVAVIAIEDTHAGEERERPGGYRARRQQVRPDGHVGKRRERRVAEVALLLNPVRRHRSDLTEHVLPGVIDAGAATQHRFTVLVDVPSEPSTGLKLFPLIRDRAIRRKSWIVQKSSVGRGLRVDGLRHLLSVPAKAVINGQTMANLPLVLNEQCELFVADVRRAGRVAGWAVGTAALEIEEKRAAARARSGGTTRRRRDVCSIRTADREGPESARRGRRCVPKEPDHTVEDVAPFEESTKDLHV